MPQQICPNCTRPHTTVLPRPKLTDKRCKRCKSGFMVPHGAGPQRDGAVATYGPGHIPEAQMGGGGSHFAMSRDDAAERERERKEAERLRRPRTREPRRRERTRKTAT
jgi:hypothetical protein